MSPRDNSINRKLRSYILALILPTLLCFLPGIIMLVAGVNQFFYENSSKNWPRAEGKIVSSKVTSYTGKRTHYDAKIIYEYKTGGKTYTGSEVSFWMVSSSDGEEIRTIVNKYPVGSSVLVYYNSDDPTIAILEPGPAWINMGIFFGIIVSIAGLWFYLLFLRHKKLLIDDAYHRMHTILTGISLFCAIGVISLFAARDINWVVFVISAIGMVVFIEIWITKRKAEGKWVRRIQISSRKSSSTSPAVFLVKPILVAIFGLLPFVLLGLFISVVFGLLIGGSGDITIRAFLGLLPPVQKPNIIDVG